MPGHGEKYCRLREVAIVSLLAHPSLAEASKSVGISERALRMWMGKDDFAEAVRSLRRQVLEAGASRLTGLVSEAIEALQAGLKSRKAADRTRAARSILEFQQRLDKDHLRERVEQLERQLSELQRPRGAMTVNGVLATVSVTPDAMCNFLLDRRSTAPPVAKVIEHQPAQQEGRE